MADIQGINLELDQDDVIRDRLRKTGKLLLDPDAGHEHQIKADGTRKQQERALKPGVPMLVINERPLMYFLVRTGLDTTSDKVPGVPDIFRELQLLYANYAQCDQSHAEIAIEMWDIKRACQKIKEVGWKLYSRPLKDFQ